MAKSFDILKGLSVDNDTFNQFTIGEVVDTNDPQQMGRVRIACPYFGDTESSIINSLPWATPISPLAGSTVSTFRGRDDEPTDGPVSYGMFNIPKVGSFALVGCIEGDPKLRIYLGGMHDQFLPHTIPHGRYTYQKNDKLTDEPSGPLSSTEEPIEPLFSTQTEMFTKTSSNISQFIPEPRKSFEYRSRGADRGVAGIHNTYIISEEIDYTQIPDQQQVEFTEGDGNTINYTFGYDESRVQDGLTSGLTGNLYDPQVYAWTTPGFHSISMSDSADNCRLRLRTTQGHQVIMDDTNERIYISTAGGKTWIEMDEAGNIDIYGERNISVHAEKDINFTAGDTFRVKAKNGIHLISEGEMRMHAKAGKIHMKSGDTTEINTGGDLSISVPNLLLTASGNVHIKAESGVLNLESGLDANLLSLNKVNIESLGGDINVNSSSSLKLTAGAGTDITAGGDILQTANEIHMNGTTASLASSAAPASSTVPPNTFEAYWPDRVPEHEPWARMMTNASSTDNNGASAASKPVDNTHINAGEYTDYNDKNIGRIERGDDLSRNSKWHR